MLLYGYSLSPSHFLILPVLSPYTLQHMPLKRKNRVRIFSNSGDADINNMNSEYILCCVLYFSFSYAFLECRYYILISITQIRNKSSSMFMDFLHWLYTGFESSWAHSTPYFRNFYSNGFQSVVPPTQLYQHHLGTC